jgi:hypothetical protein
VSARNDLRAWKQLLSELGATIIELYVSKPIAHFFICVVKWNAPKSSNLGVHTNLFSCPEVRLEHVDHESTFPNIDHYKF